MTESKYRAEDHNIAVSGGALMRVRCVIPVLTDNVSEDPFPVMVWFHPGGMYVHPFTLRTAYSLVLVSVCSGIDRSRRLSTSTYLRSASIGHRQCRI